MNYHSSNPLLGDVYGQVARGNELGALREAEANMGPGFSSLQTTSQPMAPIAQGQIYPVPSCSKCLPPETYGNFGTTDINALVQQVSSQSTTAANQAEAERTAAAANLYGVPVPGPGVYGKAMPATQWLPAQKQLVKDRASSPGVFYSEGLPVIHYFALNYNCFFGPAGDILAQPPNLQCASAWAALNTSPFEYDPEYHFAMLEMLRPHIQQLVKAKAVQTPTTQAPLAVVPAPFKMPRWAIVLLLLGAGLGLWYVIK